MGFEDSQPRDSDGKWGSGGGGGLKESAGKRSAREESSKKQAFAKLGKAKRTEKSKDVTAHGGNKKVAEELENGWFEAGTEDQLRYTAAVAVAAGNDPKEAIARAADAFVEGGIVDRATVEKWKKNAIADAKSPKYKKNVEAMAAASQAQYPDEEVTLYRGISGDQAAQIQQFMKDNPGKPVELALDHATSFTENPKTAGSFAADGIVIEVKVPRTSIALSHRAATTSRMRKSDEEEVVVATKGGLSLDPKKITQGISTKSTASTSSTSTQSEAPKFKTKSWAEVQAEIAAEEAAARR